jgi:hypothetical protein
MISGELANRDSEDVNAYSARIHRHSGNSQNSGGGVRIGGFHYRTYRCKPLFVRIGQL